MGTALCLCYLSFSCVLFSEQWVASSVFILAFTLRLLAPCSKLICDCSSFLIDRVGNVLCSSASASWVVYVISAKIRSSVFQIPWGWHEGIKTNIWSAWSFSAFSKSRLFPILTFPYDCRMFCGQLLLWAFLSPCPTKYSFVVLKNDFCRCRNSCMICPSHPYFLHYSLLMPFCSSLHGSLQAICKHDV